MKTNFACGVGFAVASSLGSFQAYAAPVEMDTPAAHIIIVRPIDLWSGDRSAREDSLDVVRAKKANYAYREDERHTFPGGPQSTEERYKNSLTRGVREELERRGFTLDKTLDYVFRVEPPRTVAPGKWQALAQLESDALRAGIVASGDPSTLQSRVTGRKFMGGVLSVLTVGIVGSTIGSSAAQATLGSGIAGDVYQSALAKPGVLAVADLPPLDESAYKQIDVRPLVFKGGMVGQIIIAYKEEKTPEAETEALIQGIVSAAGADTTVEDIEHARAADYEFRHRIWADCVAAGKCAAEAATPSVQPERNR